VADAIGVKHCGRDAGWAGVGVPEERGPFAPRCIEHGEEIADTLIQRGHVRQAIGQPEATRVRKDESREARHPREEPFHSGLLPQHLEMRHRPRCEQKIWTGRRRARDLICERRPVVPRVRSLPSGHRSNRAPSDAACARAITQVREGRLELPRRESRETFRSFSTALTPEHAESLFASTSVQEFMRVG
jgi:hypothetical protein